MKNILRHKEILSVLKSANPKLRSAIIANADCDLIKTLIEIIVNLLDGNLPLSNKQKKKLGVYKRKLRRLYRECYNKKSHKVKKVPRARKLVIQSGGALPFLIPLLAPLIAKAALTGAVGATAGYAVKKILPSSAA